MFKFVLYPIFQKPLMQVTNLVKKTAESVSKTHIATVTQMVVIAADVTVVTVETVILSVKVCILERIKKVRDPFSCGRVFESNRTQYFWWTQSNTATGWQTENL